MNLQSLAVAFGFLMGWLFLINVAVYRHPEFMKTGGLRFFLLVVAMGGCAVGFCASLAMV
jgi:hypothetical protein